MCYPDNLKNVYTTTNRHELPLPDISAIPSPTSRRVRLPTTLRPRQRTTQPGTGATDETSELASILMQIPGAALAKDDDRTGDLVNQMLARLPGAVRQASKGTSGFSAGQQTPGGGSNGGGGSAASNRRQILQACTRAYP